MFDIKAAKPFYSALILALVCSALVAAAAVGLRPYQQANQELDQKKNILLAADLYQEGTPIAKMFAAITPKLVELSSGKYIDDPQLLAHYNQQEASLSPNSSRKLPAQIDIARLKRLENYAKVYLVNGHSGLEQIILPVRGKGLWSTMYAYIAIDADLTTINGISFYKHGETPGLGGEIENPRWLSLWPGKKIYSPQGIESFQVSKNKPNNGEKAYHVDAISGATFTSNGVSELIQFWFGNNGFKPYLQRLEKEKENG